MISELVVVVFAESVKQIPDVENVRGHRGVELSRSPVVMKCGDWVLKVVPWIGGRIISMEHGPSGRSTISSWIGQKSSVRSMVLTV